MLFTKKEKNKIKKSLASALSVEKEVRRVVVFGSFLSDRNPHDLDIAIFQDSNEKYLDLAMRYRKDIRSIAKRIPVDVIPLKIGVSTDSFLLEIEKGEVVYER